LRVYWECSEDFFVKKAAWPFRDLLDKRIEVEPGRWQFKVWHCQSARALLYCSEKVQLQQPVEYRTLQGQYYQRYRQMYTLKPVCLK
jgi:hypothetical protein